MEVGLAVWGPGTKPGPSAGRDGGCDGVRCGSESLSDEVDEELERLETLVGGLEFRRMFSGEADSNNCYLDIQAGSGGTEAQDWGSMLHRMYLRWAEKKGFKVETKGCGMQFLAFDLEL